MQQSRDKLLAAKLAGLSKFMRVERRIYIDGRQFDFVLSLRRKLSCRRISQAVYLLAPMICRQCC